MSLRTSTSSKRTIQLATAKNEESTHSTKPHRVYGANLIIYILSGMAIVYITTKAKSALVTFSAPINEYDPDDTIIITPAAAKKGKKYAIAHFLDGTNLFGLYSIKNQLEKFNMTHDIVSHVVVLPYNVDDNTFGIVESWVGNENVRKVPKRYILYKIPNGIWKETFNKLWLFNLTEFDKVIVLDMDILVRSNIMHWFEYSTPCATQPQNTLSWNSGAMVIEPNSTIFDQMVSELPTLQRFGEKKNSTGEQDHGIMGYSDQDFISSFFTRNSKHSKNRCIMPEEASVLSSSLEWNKHFTMSYFKLFRENYFQTVHFTTHKPWRDTTHPEDPFLCAMLWEWKQSTAGIEKYYPDKNFTFTIQPLKNNYFSKCEEPNTSQ